MTGTASPAPTRPPALARAAVLPAEPAALLSVPNSVILGEDEMLMRGLVRSVLQQADQTVFPAADGEEVLTLARQFRARLVILDVAMPRLNGLMALRRLRDLPGYTVVPAVVLTGYTDPRIRFAAEQLGVREYITKPFRPDALLLRLARYLDIPSRTLAALPRDADQDHSMPRRAQVWPRSAGRALGHGGEADDQPSMVAGRDTIRIMRRAERKS